VGHVAQREVEQLRAARSTIEPCLYEWPSPVHGRVCILVYVDELIVAGERFAAVEAIKRGVSDRFDVRNMEAVTHRIVMNVMRDKGARTLTLSNPGHIMALLQAFGMDTCTHRKTTMASGVHLSKTGERLLTDNSR